MKVHSMTRLPRYSHEPVIVSSQGVRLQILSHTDQALRWLRGRGIVARVTRVSDGKLMAGTFQTRGSRCPE